MNRFKKTVALLVAGFFAFAPPGTLIGIFLLLAALVGDARVVAAGVVFLIIGGALLYILKRRRAVK